VSAVSFIVPDGIDDPGRPSGGNVYDRRVGRGLTEIGWSVQELPVPGDWPRPDPAALGVLGQVVARVPDDRVVLADGLVASAGSEVLLPETARLRLVVLVHMPLGHRGPADETPGVRAGEAAVLRGARAVVTTSEWTRGWLIDHYGLAPRVVFVAEPGVEMTPLAVGSPSGGRLLCVGAVIPGKGHDVLLEALGLVADLSWQCVCVGPLDRDEDFVRRLRARARQSGLGDRVRFTGSRVGADLDAAYAAADLHVLATRGETYAMVVTESLARGLPVVATSVGGIPEALGRGTSGIEPGMLVPPGDPVALAGALRLWLTEPSVRRRWRDAARQRRSTLIPWSQTSHRIAHVLSEVAA
jgi:glycosyltransferase involved in cell wall biosynthesis